MGEDMTRLSHLSLGLATALATTVAPLAATADSGLGFLGANSSIGYISLNDTSIATADGTLDYAISRYHGLQLDLGTTSFPDHWQGTLAGHLYMRPNADAKYGLFAAYTDINQEAASIGTLGIEGLWAIKDQTLLSMRAGIGLYQPDNRDFIFGDIGVKTGIGDRLALSASLSGYDLEESDLASRDLTAALGATWSFATAPVDLTLSASYSFVTDTAGNDDSFGVSALLTWRPGGNRQAIRPLYEETFAPVRPLTGLLARHTVRSLER